jgi:hypothetical protein
LQILYPPRPEQAQTGVVLLVLLLLTYILLLFSDAILRIIGRQGAAILVRVMVARQILKLIRGPRSLALTLVALPSMPATM